MKKNKVSLTPVNTPIYNYFQALYLSFFSPKLYVDVGKRWKGLGVAYLFLLIFIVTLPFSARLGYEFNTFFQEDLIEPLQNLPTLYIQNGLVSLDKPMPYYVKNPKNEVVAIVDTTGKIKTIPAIYPKLTTLITQDKLFYRFPAPVFFYNDENIVNHASPVYVYPFDKSSNSIFEGKQWVKDSGINRLKNFFSFLLYPSVAFVFFVIFMFLLLAFALMGQLIARLFKLNITYTQSSRLVMVSITPFMVVLWTFFALGLVSHRFGFIMPLLIILYFCFAVASLKRESRKLVIA